MASGGIRYDFTEDDGFTHHENRTIRLPVLDIAGVFVDDTIGWEFGFWISDLLRDNRTTLELGADAVVEVLDADITQTSAAIPSRPDLGTGPCIDIPLVPADFVGQKARIMFYEAYRTDADNQTRIAYGEFPLID